MEDSSTKSWNQIAEAWVIHADMNDYRNVFLIPHTFALLGNVTGKNVLDVGCGEGGYTRMFASKGAYVTGIDGSDRLIEIAKRRAEKENLSIVYHVTNSNSLSEIADETFDVVLAAMSLMDVEDYCGAIAEIYRVLRIGGEFLMSITHPCFTGRGSGWRKNADGVADHYVIDNYVIRETWEEFITDKFARPVLFRHMPLADFISPLLELGFKLALLEEPTPTPEQIQQSGRLKRLNRIPLFLFLKWVK
jgi:ubiquinone/menaquinone biosynthesis C-methylase UbiE